jgi:hypothetical protein
MGKITIELVAAMQNEGFADIFVYSAHTVLAQHNIAKN